MAPLPCPSPGVCGTLQSGCQPLRCSLPKKPTADPPEQHPPSRGVPAGFVSHCFSPLSLGQALELRGSKVARLRSTACPLFFQKEHWGRRALLRAGRQTQTCHLLRPSFLTQGEPLEGMRRVTWAGAVEVQGPRSAPPVIGLQPSLRTFSCTMSGKPGPLQDALGDVWLKSPTFLCRKNQAAHPSSAAVRAGLSYQEAILDLSVFCFCTAGSSLWN